MDHPFRSAAVGGFNKQDVLTFLEEQSRQFSQAQQRFQEQLDGANQQIETLRRREEELSGRLEEAQRELETARQGRESQTAQAEKAGAELSASRAREEQTAKELERARRERDRVQAELDQILPDAQAYAQIKERTAGVELDAHRRAQAIQEKAERDAQRVRRQLEQWLRRMEAEYDRAGRPEPDYPAGGRSGGHSGGHLQGLRRDRRPQAGGPHAHPGGGIRADAPPRGERTGAPDSWNDRLSGLFFFR